MRLLTFFILSLPITLASSLRPRNASVACNNSPDLCSRPYSEITHLGAHDSPFIRDAANGYSDSGNQDVNTTVQLNAGVRLLSAQVHNNNSSWDVCHTSCSLLDAGPLSSWLAEIKAWMDVNPNDVVTVLLVNSDDATAAELDAQYQTAGIKSYVYTPPSTTAAPATWPTLQEMISASTRLVTFVASLDSAGNTVAPYLLDEFTFVFENPFDVTSASNFSCTANRPASVLGNTAAALSADLLPLMNHFLDISEAFGIEIPNLPAINTTNGPSGGVGNLGSAASTCTTAYGKAPTFILVDFFEEGPAINTVDTLNNIAPVGRISPTAAKVVSSTSDGNVGKTILSCGTLFCLIGLSMAIFA